MNWRTEIRDKVRRDLVDQQGFERLLGAKGIANDDTVVLYGGNNNWFAAYAYWLFKFYGHRDVKLMNGGRKKWELEDRALTNDPPPSRPRNIRRRPQATGCARCGTKCSRQSARCPWWTCARPTSSSAAWRRPPTWSTSKAQRKGRTHRGRRTFHGPRRPTKTAHSRAMEDFAGLYGEEVGLVGDQPTIAYCRIGERSTHTWFVLHELLGYQNVKNYDGSWTEYGSLVGVPIERTYWEESDSDGNLRPGGQRLRTRDRGLRLGVARR